MGKKRRGRGCEGKSKGKKGEEKGRGWEGMEEECMYGKKGEMVGKEERRKKRKRKT